MIKVSCPRCGNTGYKRFRGYCSKVHYRLDKRPHKVHIACTSCGTIQVRNPSQIAKSGRVFCKSCGKNPGEHHPKWAEGQYISKDGYRLIIINGSYLREHRVVWEEANKASLLPNGTIHHIDYDKLNNSPDNLLLLSSEEHGRFHRLVEANRRAEAAAILRMAGARQYYYPRNVDSFTRDNLGEIYT